MKTFKFDSGENVFFTSDTHFGHKNILDFCPRGCDTVEEMNDKIIQNWNSVVGNNDFIFHLGDFAFGGSQLWVNTLKQLNGNIVLIKGNHDVKNYQDTYSKYFTYVDTELFITVDNQPIYLNHYPFLTYAGIHRDKKTWQLFGHVHLNPSYDKNHGKDFERMRLLLPSQYDVGCDMHNCTPISYDFVKERINYQIENNTNIMHWIQ